MAQPDFGEIGKCLSTLGTQVRLINNHPAVNQGAQILAALQAMEGKLQAVEGRLVARIDQMNVRIDEVNARVDQMNAPIDQTNTRIDELAQVQQIDDKKSLARALNSTSVHSEHRLYPLPLPNGDEIPEGQFPNTLRDLRELEGVQLGWLLEAYKLDVPPGASVYDKRGILAMHCAIGNV
ncbi:hypothetical protein RSOLAG22IIIB_11373 [Rhizoctonia solani]|uniref:Uncharacterized protein n=1 Tax=Rhizoctonia solani TaxID=456999 RepID=A0A0K6G857_9AGAM|nr:hypothetical protein RSOLAG22IIIB_11373 [Rhizoctonia solani]